MHRYPARMVALASRLTTASLSASVFLVGRVSVLKPTNLVFWDVNCCAGDGIFIEMFLDSGETCNLDVSKQPCDPNPCQGGGTCSSLPSGGFSCRCPPGRKGHRCHLGKFRLAEAESETQEPDKISPEF